MLCAGANGKMDGWMTCGSELSEPLSVLPITEDSKALIGSVGGTLSPTATNCSSENANTFETGYISRWGRYRDEVEMR